MSFTVFSRRPGEKRAVLDSVTWGRLVWVRGRVMPSGKRRRECAECRGELHGGMWAWRVERPPGLSQVRSQRICDACVNRMSAT